jgi:signal transduction histidine kinase
MKIKIKLLLGIGLLFAMILLLAILSSVYLYALKNDTQNILVANYNTLEYCRNMLTALDDLPQNANVSKTFAQNLRKQQQNITEVGEKEATEQLSEHFVAWQKTSQALSRDSLAKMIRQDISEIMRLNMQAIKTKSKIADTTAQTATFWIAVAGTICFLIAFTMLLNLPENIANPIHTLTESIKKIAQENYAHRVYLDRQDEFQELAQSFNTMAQKLEEYNQSNVAKLLFEKKRIETLINNMKDFVMGLDEHNQVLFVNDEAVKILNVSRTDLVGKNAQAVAIQNDLMRSLMQSFMHNELHRKEPYKIFIDGKESYFEQDIMPISITPTGEYEPIAIGSVIMLRNITPFKELDFAKTNFIATISHELKTPVSAIKMSLQIIENQQLNELNQEQKELLQGIKEEANRLLKIISELLKLSQVETGNIQLNLQESNPLEILQYSLDAVKVPLEQKQIQLKTILPITLPALRADAEKTTWVLINLLTNAIRYTPEKSNITVEVKQIGEQVVFSVKDQGRGIDARYQNKIFERYFQVPQNGVGTGTGLGLAISKEFIEAQGGEIGVASEVGLGSTFWFSLKAS